MLELEHEFRVRDTHVRLSPAAVDGGRDAARDRTLDDGPVIGPGDLERELRQAGIVRAVVFPPATDDRLQANNAVARMSTDRPFVPFARIGESDGAHRGPLDRLPGRGPTDLDATTIEQYATDDRFQGFVLDPERDGIPHPDDLERLADEGRPILVLAGEDFPPSKAVPLFDLGTPVILAHFGGHPLRRPLMREAIGLLDHHEHCFLDTSYVRYRDLLARALREHPDRVLFGSGTPATHPSVAVAELLSVDIPEDGLRKAFERNPERVVDGL